MQKRDHPTLANDAWRGAGLRYNSFHHHLRGRYGERVQKVSIDAGFTCPNVDGTVTTGGCTFCDNRSFSPSRRQPRIPIRDQIDLGIAKLQRRYRNCRRFVAYFQPATNTYGPVDRLRNVYTQAMDHPSIVALAVGTRPDCVPDDVIDLLDEFAQRIDLTVEYGAQTIHNRSLDWMNRGHHHDAFVDAVTRSRGRGFTICAHVILGLPGESHDDMLATAQEMARLDLDAIKIHNLYAVRNTELAVQVAGGEVTLMERDDYVRAVVEFIELLPPRMLIERVSGDAPPTISLAPVGVSTRQGSYVRSSTNLSGVIRGKVSCSSSQLANATYRARSVAHETTATLTSRP